MRTKASSKSGFELDGIAVSMSEDDLLGHLQAERQQSVGFEENGTIETERQQALEYIKGEMKDVPSGANRSSVVASDVADAIETVLPDLMEIFTGGEDIGTFKPTGEEDEESAQQETDFINDVVFEQNPGFSIFETALRNGLEVKTALAKHYWSEESETETFEGKSAVEVQAAKMSADVSEIEQVGVSPDGEPLYNFTATRVTGKEVIETVDPANFGVSPDTVTLGTSPYCIERSYPRAFQLTDMGYDPEKVMLLPPSDGASNDAQSDARDTVGEGRDGDTIFDDTRRQVEVHTHTIRIDLDGDGKTELWCIVTDCEENIILDAYRKNRVGYAAGSPFRRAHRFYGFSLADKLIEIQKIKTSLMRMVLDNGYFALNRRNEVSEKDMSEFTINDLMANQPGMPVRSKTGQAVRSINEGGLSFDAVGALEYFSTVAEQRSGVVRNAQGLNPDTLHDTAKGAEQLMTMAQRRIRMIARVLAETFVKDLFVGVHGDIREHSTQSQKIRLRNKWVEVDPTSWGARSDMTIEVGVGSGGREREIFLCKELIGLQAQAIEAQAAGIVKQPLVTEQEIYNASRRLIERMGFKSPELYLKNPEESPPQPEQEGPSPEEQAAMADLQMKQQQAQAEMQLKQQIAAEEVKLTREKAQAELMAKREAAELDRQLAREKAQAEYQLAQEKMQNERELAIMKANMEAELGALKMQTESRLSENRPGGRLDQ